MLVYLVERHAGTEHSWTADVAV